jgi:hypothetical protein
LKKKALVEKQQGKQPQVQGHAQPQVEEMPLPKKNQANAPIVEKSSEKKVKKRTCYICREKGHLSSSCTMGNSSNPIIIDDVYSLCKDMFGNVLAKYVGAQSGVKKRTIWVAKPIVTKVVRIQIQILESYDFMTIQHHVNPNPTMNPNLIESMLSPDPNHRIL